MNADMRNMNYHCQALGSDTPMEFSGYISSIVLRLAAFFAVPVPIRIHASSARRTQRLASAGRPY